MQSSDKGTKKLFIARIDHYAKKFFDKVELFRAGSFAITVIIFMVLLFIFLLALGFFFNFRCANSSYCDDPNAIVSSISTFFIAFFGFLAMIGATLHLFEVQRQNQMAVEIQKASFLLDLDKRFIQPEMLVAQQELSTIWERASSRLEDPDMPEKELRTKSTLGQEIEKRRIVAKKQSRQARNNQNNTYHEAFCDYMTSSIAHDLDHLRRSDPSLYHTLLRNCEIFETMGLLRNRGYLNFGDISTRFTYAIHRVYVSFWGHIQIRGKDPYSQKIFANVIDLGRWHENELKGKSNGSLAWINPKPL